PDLGDLSAVQGRDDVTNLQEAFDLAEKHLNVPRLLEPEDVNVEKPDEKSIGGEDRAATSSPTPPKKQTEQSRRSSSPLKSKDQRTSSTTPPPGNGKGKAQGNSVRNGTSSPKSSTADEPMDTSPDKETNLSPHKRREARSTSPSPTSTAPKKPRVSQGKLSASSDHSDRLKSKRHSLAVESKKLSVPGEPGHKKRASVAGTLSTSRKLSSGSRKLSSGSRKSSSTGPAPMDVESSSSDLEDSEVRRHFVIPLKTWIMIPLGGISTS
ncbi:Nesprin-1, partial [Desmophyllum pertusum]